MTISKLDREDMRSWTNPAWWTRPVCWSGVRNDLERRALQHEAAADYAHEPSDGYWRNRARHEARLAAKADSQVLGIHLRTSQLLNR